MTLPSRIANTSTKHASSTSNRTSGVRSYSARTFAYPMYMYENAVKKSVISHVSGSDDGDQSGQQESGSTLEVEGAGTAGTRVVSAADLDGDGTQGVGFLVSCVSVSMRKAVRSVLIVLVSIPDNEVDVRAGIADTATYGPVCPQALRRRLPPMLLKQSLNSGQLGGTSFVASSTIYLQ